MLSVLIVTGTNIHTQYSLYRSDLDSPHDLDQVCTAMLGGMTHPDLVAGLRTAVKHDRRTFTFREQVIVWGESVSPDSVVMQNLLERIE